MGLGKGNGGCMTHNEFVKQYGQEMWLRLDIIFMNHYKASNKSIAEAPMLEVVNGLRPSMGRWQKLDCLKNFLRVKFPGNMEPVVKRDGEGMMPRGVPHNEVYVWHRRHRKNFPRVFKIVDLNEVMEKIKTEGLGPKKPTYTINKWSQKKEWAESTEPNEWGKGKSKIEREKIEGTVKVEYVEDRKKKVRRKSHNGRAIRRAPPKKKKK